VISVNPIKAETTVGIMSAETSGDIRGTVVGRYCLKREMTREDGREGSFWAK